MPSTAYFIMIRPLWAYIVEQFGYDYYFIWQTISSWLDVFYPG